MEIWWIGKDGSIQNASWHEGGQWIQQEIAPCTLNWEQYCP
ncbi:hypothetical protein [Bacillus tropicus]